MYSRTSIIKMDVSLNEHALLTAGTQACADAHKHYVCTALLSLKWVDQGVVYPFDCQYPACLWNQGVRIIEVVLYCTVQLLLFLHNHTRWDIPGKCVNN